MKLSFRLEGISVLGAVLLRTPSPWSLTPLLVAMTLLLSGAASAQVASNYNPRDDQYRLLGMTRAQADYERAQREYDRKIALQKSGGAADQEVESARAQMENARVNYLQAALAIVFESPHVLIDRAVKFQKGDGRKYVRVTLRNESNSGSEGAKLESIIDSTLLRQLRPEEIPNVFVSLKDEAGTQGAIISNPYEARIPVLAFGKPVTLEFRLLKDVDVTTVSVSYANQLSERRVFLEKDASANIVTVQSSQFSQEADLGDQVTYDLSLERFTADASGFRLAVGGLPKGIRAEFRDPATNARLTQMRFAEGTTSQRLQLVLSLPTRDAGQFKLDGALPFFALAMDAEASSAFDRAAGDSLTESEAAAINAGKVRLELVPHGNAKIEVRSANLYNEIVPGDSVTMELTLRNLGSRPASSIRIRPLAQGDWRATISPELIQEIPIDKEARVTLTLVPPAGVAVGDYDVRLETDALSADRRVDVEDKIVRVHVAPPANWIGTTLLVLLMAGVLGGMVWFGMKLTRR